MPKKITLSEHKFNQIQQFYLDAHSLKETAAHFQLGYAWLYEKFKGRGWMRPRGVHVHPRPVQAYDDSALVAFKREWDKIGTAAKGTIAEGYAKIKLAELGFDVWEPVAQNHITDLIVLNSDGVLKLQVKSATYDPKRKCYRANLLRHRRGGDHTEYADTDLDYFIVVCGGMPSMEYYVIPFAAANRNKTPKLFPHREKAVQFTEFTFEKYRNAFEQLK